MARTGFGAAKEAMEKAANSGGGFTRRLDYFNLKDGESMVVRFLSDDPLTVNFYEYVFDVKGKPQNFIQSTDYFEPGDPDWDGKDWVVELGGRCKDKGLTGEWCDPKPKERTVALAVIREEAPREDGEGKVKIRYRDAISTIKVKDGKDGPETEFPARRFIIVKQAYKNFWSMLIAYFHENDTICDRDYKITRNGGGTDTTYSIIPKAEDPEFDIIELQARYGYGTGKTIEGEDLTPDHGDRFLYCPMTIDEWAKDHCSERRVKYFLTGDQSGGESNSGGGYEGTGEFAKSTTHNPAGGGDEAQAAPPPEASKDLTDLRARLERHK